VMNNRLALGTVQFGLSYGIAGQGNKVAGDEVDAILSAAWEGGLDTLDTAILYGDCEQLLGQIGVDQWQVVTKLTEVPETCTDVASWVQDSVIDSIGRLGVPRLRGLLLHRPQQLLGSHGDDFYRALVSIREQGSVEKIGISIYGPDELDALWPHYQFDLVQAPFNVLDRRLVSSGWLNRLHQAGTEVHIRSVFLQGLLLMDDVSRPEKFNRWQPLWDQWHHWLNDQGVTALQGCLAIALSQPEVDRVIVGVDGLKQLEEILACAETSVAMPPEALMSDDLDLINPSRWSAY
jgi:aryl-alcohol dehydrogenase-like predicted oxidoreductase